MDYEINGPPLRLMDLLLNAACHPPNLERLVPSAHPQSLHPLHAVLISTPIRTVARGVGDEPKSRLFITLINTTLEGLLGPAPDIMKRDSLAHGPGLPLAYAPASASVMGFARSFTTMTKASPMLNLFVDGQPSQTQPSPNPAGNQNNSHGRWPLPLFEESFLNAECLMAEYILTRDPM